VTPNRPPDHSVDAMSNEHGTSSEGGTKAVAIVALVALILTTAPVIIALFL
jgi:hypothetical protein